MFFLIVALVQLFPLIWLIDFSFLSSNEFYSSSVLKWPSDPQWQNYINAWVDGKFLRYFINSVLVTSVTILLTVILSLTLGYAFTRMQWKLRPIFFTIILLGIMIPIHATLLPNFAIFKALGLTDSYLGLILPYTAVSVPLGTFILTGFMRSIPKSYGRVRCSRRREYLQDCLPDHCTAYRACTGYGHRYNVLELLE
ncbi:carbohydrate ABC transporter permease [Paenibacillus rhizoplanae]